MELVGRWQVRKYLNNNNVEVRVNEVVVESITVFSKEPKQTQPTQTPVNEYDDSDLPF